MEVCSVSGAGILESRPSLHFFTFFKVFQIILLNLPVKSTREYMGRDFIHGLK